MTSRSLITTELFTPPADTGQLASVVYGIVGTVPDAQAALRDNIQLVNTNSAMFGDAGSSASISRILLALNLYGVAQAVVLPKAANALATGWGELANTGETVTGRKPTHLVGDDIDFAVSGSGTAGVAVDNTAANALVSAKQSAAEALDAIAFVSAPAQLTGASSAVVQVPIAQITAWGAINPAPRTVGCVAMGLIVPTFRTSGSWTMTAAPFVAGAVASQPYYQHAEYRTLQGVSSIAGTGVQFAPKNPSASSEQLKFNNLIGVIHNRGAYRTWGKSLMYASASTDVRKYVHVRATSDYFERVLDNLYLTHITARSRSQLARLLTSDMEQEINRVVTARGLRGGTCVVDSAVTGNRLGLTTTLSFENPVDTVVNTKIIEIG